LRAISVRAEIVIGIPGYVRVEVLIRLASLMLIAKLGSTAI
jgi:hypothetical protein